MLADNQAGAAMWLPPGASHEPSLKASSRLAVAILGQGSVPTLRRAMAAGKALSAALPSEPHVYLSAIGVRPESQGQGLGQRLMAPVLHRCDELGLPVYLESSNPAKHGFHAGHGFATREMLTPVPGGPPVETMWREPRPKA